MNMNGNRSDYGLIKDSKVELRVNEISLCVRSRTKASPSPRILYYCRALARRGGRGRPPLSPNNHTSLVKHCVKPLSGAHFSRPNTPTPFVVPT
jgi:hypothetical protein